MKWSWRNFSFILWDYISKQKYCSVFSEVLFPLSSRYHFPFLYSHTPSVYGLWNWGKKSILEVIFLDVFNNKMEKETENRMQRQSKRDGKIQIKTLFQKFTLCANRCIQFNWVLILFIRIDSITFSAVASRPQKHPHLQNLKATNSSWFSLFFAVVWFGLVNSTTSPTPSIKI